MFWDVIELEISLINRIKGLIKTLSKFGADLDHNYKEWKYKGQSENTVL